MHKKHYIEIAHGFKIARLPEDNNEQKAYNAAIRDLAHYQASIFAKDNPLFDRSKFLTACGV